MSPYFVFCLPSSYLFKYACFSSQRISHLDLYTPHKLASSWKEWLCSARKPSWVSGRAGTGSSGKIGQLKLWVYFCPLIAFLKLYSNVEKFEKFNFKTMVYWSSSLELTQFYFLILVSFWIDPRKLAGYRLLSCDINSFYAHFEKFENWLQSFCFGNFSHLCPVLKRCRKKKRKGQAIRVKKTCLYGTDCFPPLRYHNQLGSTAKCTFLPLWFDHSDQN